MEVWKDIKGYEGHYQVSNEGKVRSIKRKEPKLLTLLNHSMGYYVINLCKPKTKMIQVKVHRLVADLFIPNHGDDTTIVNHIDGDKKNNRVSNLEWTNHGGNLKHSYDYNLRSKKGENHHLSKLKDSDVRKIRNLSSEGFSNVALSKMFNVSDGTICMIVKRKRWKHIK